MKMHAVILRNIRPIQLSQSNLTCDRATEQERDDQVDLTVLCYSAQRSTSVCYRWPSRFHRFLPANWSPIIRSRTWPSRLGRILHLLFDKCILV